MIITNINEETILAKVLLNLWDAFRGNAGTLDIIRTGAQYGFDTGGVIYDTIEYMDNELLLLSGEIDSVEGQDELRKGVEEEIKRIYPESNVRTLSEEDKANFVSVGKLIYDDIKHNPEKLANYAAFLHLIDKTIPQPVDEFTDLIKAVEQSISELKQTL